jgi:2-haloacid dehalogenase
MLVTFDLFSALIDSRTGGSTVLGRLAADRGWAVDGERLYEEWDRRNKASQRDGPEWVPFAEHCRRALAATYAELHLSEDLDLATGDAALLNRSVADWPLWPDVASQLPELARRYRVGVLSNVDDAIFARTRVAPLVDDAAVLTSERLRAYKPAPELYLRAVERAEGDLTHVATSARDVRGALEAGIRVVRLRRPGHQLDPAGPAPRSEASDVRGVGELLDGVAP